MTVGGNSYCAVGVIWRWVSLMEEVIDRWLAAEMVGGDGGYWWCDDNDGGDGG